jgi:hypothetical protein
MQRPRPQWAVSQCFFEGLGRKKEAALHCSFLGVIAPPAASGSAHIFVAPDFPKSFGHQLVAVRIMAGLFFLSFSRVVAYGRDAEGEGLLQWQVFLPNEPTYDAVLARMLVRIAWSF